MKHKLDKIFSEYIRLRDANNDGIVRCYCCGKSLPWRESENMHFIPRRHLSLRYSETNCHAGCTGCNCYNYGNIEKYTARLKKEYGEDIIDRLTVIKNVTHAPSDSDYQILIDHYKLEIKKLRKEKGIKN
jgi:hypothetical protein